MNRSTTKPRKWPAHLVKTEISLCISPVWSESSLSAWRNLWSLATHKGQSEVSDQTGRMHRLIWVFAGRTGHFFGFGFDVWNKRKFQTKKKKNTTFLSSWSIRSIPICRTTKITTRGSLLSWDGSNWVLEPIHTVFCRSAKQIVWIGLQPSLIRVFAVRMKKPVVLSYPQRAKRSLWSDWADAQADLSLRWAYRSFFWFWFWRMEQEKVSDKKNKNTTFLSSWSIRSIPICRTTKITTRGSLLSWDGSNWVLEPIHTVFCRSAKQIVWIGLLRTSALTADPHCRRNRTCPISTCIAGLWLRGISQLKLRLQEVNGFFLDKMNKA